MGGHAGAEKSTQFGLKSPRPRGPWSPASCSPWSPASTSSQSSWIAGGPKGAFRAFIAYEKVEAFRDFGGIRIEECTR